MRSLQIGRVTPTMKLTLSCPLATEETALLSVMEVQPAPSMKSG
jgi:hypothetical protein